MEFRKFTAGHRSYGRSDAAVVPQEPNVNFNDPELQQILEGQPGSEDAQAAERVITALALCHDIVIDTE